MRVSVSIIQLKGHDASINDMVGGIAVRNVDPRILADGLMKIKLKRTWRPIIKIKKR